MLATHRATLLCLLLLAASFPLPVNGTVCGTTDGSKANTIAPCTCGNEECTETTGLICYSTTGGGSCRKTAFGSFGYPRPKTGKCDDGVDERDWITSKEECGRAAVRAGLEWSVSPEVSVTTSPHYPPGCFWLQEGYPRFNTITTTAAGCSAHSSEYCLCSASELSSCTNTDASVANAAPACLCGTSPNTATCASDTGMWCLSSFNICGEHHACSITDGSAENDDACMCGVEICSETTGLICYSTEGGGSCRKNAFGSFGYPRPKEGKCTDVDGRGWIESKEECERAAARMGLSDVVASLTTDAHPPGCWWQDSKNLWFNTNANSAGSCNSHSSEHCLCLASELTSCANTNASVANAAPACLCGTTSCASDIGLWCLSAFSTCGEHHACSVTDGSAENDDACMCGVETCTETTGLICYSTEGGGSCRKNVLGSFGYPRPKEGKCTDVDGRGWIESKEVRRRKDIFFVAFFFSSFLTTILFLILFYFVCSCLFLLSFFLSPGV